MKITKKKWKKQLTAAHDDGVFEGAITTLESLIRIAHNDEITPMMLNDMLKEMRAEQNGEIPESRYEVVTNAPDSSEIEVRSYTKTMPNERRSDKRDLTPNQLAARWKVDPKALRKVLRELWPDHPAHTRWVITPAMQMQLKGKV